jgi:hypothetical protein
MLNSLGDARASILLSQKQIAPTLPSNYSIITLTKAILNSTLY